MECISVWRRSRWPSICTKTKTCTLLVTPNISSYYYQSHSTHDCSRWVHQGERGWSGSSFLHPSCSSQAFWFYVTTLSYWLTSSPHQFRLPYGQSQLHTTLALCPIPLFSYRCHPYIQFQYCQPPKCYLSLSICLVLLRLMKAVIQLVPTNALNTFPSTKTLAMCSNCINTFTCSWDSLRNSNFPIAFSLAAISSNMPLKQGPVNN